MSGLIGHCGLLMSGTTSGPVTPVTWNPSDKHADITLSSGDMVAGRTGSNTYRSVRATMARSSGKYYYEVLVGGSTSTSMMCGFATSAAVLTNYVGFGTTSWGYNGNGFTYTNNAGNSSGGIAWSPGDVLSFAYNATLGHIWMGRNGSYVGSVGADPATGIGQRFSITAGTALFPMCSIFEGATGQNFTLRTEASEFSYLPSGWSPWES